MIRVEMAPQNHLHARVRHDVAIIRLQVRLIFMALIIDIAAIWVATL